MRDSTLSPPKWPRFLFWIGVALCSAPVWGFLGTVLNMFTMFSAATSSGSTDPETMADDISSGMTFLFIGILLFFPGLVFVIIGIVAPRLAKKRALQLRDEG